MFEKLLMYFRFIWIYPNIKIVYRIYLSLMVSNSTGERSFSKLQLVKNYLRNSLTHEKLSGLALLPLESSLLKEIYQERIINIFSKNKTCKIHFYLN